MKRGRVRGSGGTEVGKSVRSRHSRRIVPMSRSTNGCETARPISEAKIGGRRRERWRIGSCFRTDEPDDGGHEVQNQDGQVSYGTSEQASEVQEMLKNWKCATHRRTDPVASARSFSPAGPTSPTVDDGDLDPRIN